MDSIQKVIGRLFFLLYNLFIFAFYIIGWVFVIFSKTKSITLKNYLKRIFFHLKKNKEKSFLFHFSSLGEMKAAEGIIKYLMAKNKNIVITVFTETAYLSAKERYDNVVLMPVDFYPVVKLFVKKISPAIAFITETEIWPSYIISLSKYSRVIWINARISERSYKRYNLLKPLLRYVFENVDSVFVQTMDDLKRFSKFIDHKKIVIAGNTKYDSDLFIEIPNDILNILKTWKNNIFTVILGSIHPDEFEYFVKAYKLLKNEKLNIKLLVVPRHIEKISEFEMILNRH
ncbi:MAG: 3-deoxy-D-manno-octulosonic acid transferase, partial [Elusimicrobiales bacterium]